MIYLISSSLGTPWIVVISSSLGTPWIVVISSYFYNIFLLWFRFPFSPFSYEVSLFYFIVFSLFQLLFFIPIFQEVENQCPPSFQYASSTRLGRYEHFLVFRMRVWCFEPLCQLFLHMDSKSRFYSIFFWLLYPKTKWVLILRFFASICVSPSFVGMMLVMDMDYLQDVSQIIFSLLCLHWDFYFIYTPDFVFG